MESFQKYLNTVAKYADWYNKIAKKDNPLVSISVLSQNRIELERKFNNFIDKSEVSELASSVKEFVSNKKQEEEIKKASKTVIDSLNIAFPYSIGFKPFFDIDLKTLKQQLRDFNELYGVQPFEWNGIEIQDDETEDIYLQFVLAIVDEAYREKIKGEKLLLKKIALEHIIEKVFENNYTENISQYITQEDAKGELRNESNKPGPKTPKLLLDDIEQILQEVSEVDRCYDNGKLVINRVVDYALDQEWFDDKWGLEGKDYSKRQLKTLFSKAMKS